MDGELYLAPGFPVPPNSDYKGYHNYIDEVLPPESPYLYGLHPNAEIEFLTTTSENLFKTVLEMQPRDSGAAAAGGVSREEKVHHFRFPKKILRGLGGQLITHQILFTLNYENGLFSYILLLSKEKFIYLTYKFES